MTRVYTHATVKTNAAFEKWERGNSKTSAFVGTLWYRGVGKPWREFPLLTRGFCTDAVGLFALKVVIKIVAMGSWH